MACPIGDLELEDKPFMEVRITEEEGEIWCYEKDDYIIIRTHTRGLIRGINIFKEWIESNHIIDPAALPVISNYPSTTANKITNTKILFLAFMICIALLAIVLFLKI